VIVANNRAASACMDLSDGLADAITQIAHASGCGIELNVEAIPIQPAARAWATAAAIDPNTVALSGGEDYELLFAVPKRRTRLFLSSIKQAGEVSVTEIGMCTKDVGTRLPSGFDHFNRQ
jgi:thiamine-monophosphate kinase